MTNSLRRQLLGWVLFPLAAAVTIDTWLTYQSAVNTATVVQERLLLGSARMIAQQISYEDGSFQHPIPPAALELFQSGEVDRIYYRVTTGSGQLLSGYTELPLPGRELDAGGPHFFDATMRSEPVHVVAFYQPVIGNPSTLPVVVQVAQTLHSRGQMTRHLWLQTVGQQLLILALATVFILFGLRRGLAPLIRLRDDVRSRKEGSLNLLQTQNIPNELKPLVNSFNDYIQRLENYTSLRSGFIQNAAHQLRTPLAVLNTQISDSLRAGSPEESNASLLAARRTLQQTIRMVQQFLTLSSAEAYVATRSELSTQDCSNVVKSVMEDLAAQAHARDIDLGFELLAGLASARVDPVALREIALNLIDNALRYTPKGGVVTVRLRSNPGSIALEVEDNGPGIPAHSHSRVFERFFRLGDTDTTGSGLGLAIVKEFATQNGGAIRLLAPSHGGHGLLMIVEFSDQ